MAIGQSIGEFELADAGVTTRKLADASVTPAKLAAQDPWHPVVFTNGWSNFGGNTPCAYSIDSMGYVHVRGTMTGGTVSLSAFTLPVGYRPTAGLAAFPAQDGAAAFRITAIRTDGTVTPTGGNNASWTLDGIVFDTRP